MATRAGIDSAIVDRLSEDHQQVFIAVKAEFDTETLRFHSGTGDITLNSESYSGLGTLLNVSNVTDTTELKSEGITVSLAGMDATVLNKALTEQYQNRLITVFMGYESGGTNVVQGVIVLFKGRMQKMEIFDNPDGSTIQVQAENRLIDLQRPSNLRFTKESQRYIDSTDTCFNMVASLQDKEIVWGKSSSSGGGSSGGQSSGGSSRRQMQK